MTTRYRHIIVATDFSDEAEHALRVGAGLARRLGSKLTLVHAFDATPYLRLLASKQPADAKSAMAAAATKELNSLSERFTDGVDDVEVVAVHCEGVAAGLCDYAREQDGSLIVIGTRGRGALMRVLVGSVAERVVRHAPCDVLVVRGAGEDWSPTRVVAPTDLSERASMAIAAVSELRQTLDAEVTLLHVYDDDLPVPATGEFKLAGRDQVIADLTKDLERTRQALFGDAEDVAVELLVGPHPADAVCKWLEDNDADLVVVSSHGRTGLAHMLMGSVAEAIIRYAPCPALAIRVREGEEA